MHGTPTTSHPRPSVRPRGARRLASVAAVALAGGLLAPPAAAQQQRQQVDGYAYTFRIETGDDDVVVGRAVVAGGQARIEIVSDSSRRERGARRRSYRVGDSDDGYLVVTDGGRTLVAVSPSEREYSSMPADEFERIVGSAMKKVDRVLTMSVSDLTVSGRRLGDGDPMHGQATRRGRVVADYVSRVGALGFTVRSVNHVEAEYWVAPGLGLPRNPLAEMLVGLPTVMAQADEDFVTRMAAGRRALVGSGTPMRVVLTAESREEEGKVDRTRTSYEITSLERTRVDPAVFQVPRGYTRSDSFSWTTDPSGKRR